MQPHRLQRSVWRSASGLAAVFLSGFLASCGGGGGSSSSAVVATFPASPALLSDSNVAALLVQAGPGANVNMPYVSVRVCEPNTRRCTTIDNVLVDTGSTGLRLFASQVNAAITLPAHTIGSSSTISECAQFLNTLAWGSVKVADVEMGGQLAFSGVGVERAPAVPVQLMDAGHASIPAACTGAPLLATSTNASNNTQMLTANGILGVGLFASDRQHYYDCASPATGCELTGLTGVRRYPLPAQQVQNPVSLFVSGNNNGVVIQLPALPTSNSGGTATGVSSAQGYLIFGVGTQANNRLNQASVIPVNAQGNFTTVYRGVSYASSFLDSGSNGLYFNDPAPSVLAGTCRLASNDFYCPGSTQNLTARMQTATSSASVSFSISSADTLFSQSTHFAFSNLGGNMGGEPISPCPVGGCTFDWGLPFFFGRTVYTVIEGKSVNTGTGTLNGPFNAFTTN
ncbi:hypothetical protein DIC66_07020 [Rhodoferax lacus]|uniref:DUF3443 domain-containing protein n=1 Tax=Rhodoferax lacus TaxID=2184758 RepID=A0A3E1RE11_9BURK|nr:DUF3443 family protein [Rhodoferax lacus]RFO97607.1 hypothetical protein DIC66_07020 [Rhodoferax lacus]